MQKFVRRSPRADFVTPRAMVEKASPRSEADASGEILPSATTSGVADGLIEAPRRVTIRCDHSVRSAVDSSTEEREAPRFSAPFRRPSSCTYAEGRNGCR